MVSIFNNFQIEYLSVAHQQIKLSVHQKKKKKKKMHKRYFAA